MMLAYVNFDDQVLVWSVGSIFGILAVSWLIYYVYQDNRRLRARKHIDPAQRNINTGDIVRESMRMVVHVVFLSLGLIGLFVRPGSLHQDIQAVTTWAFILVPSWIGLSSVVDALFRRRLDRLANKEAP